LGFIEKMRRGITEARRVERDPDWAGAVEEELLFQKRAPEEKKKKKKWKNFEFLFSMPPVLSSEPKAKPTVQGAQGTPSTQGQVQGWGCSSGLRRVLTVCEAWVNVNP
jgi:hypothetical protein